MTLIPYFDNLFWAGFRDYYHESFIYYKSGSDKVCRDCAIFSTSMIRQVRRWQEMEGQTVSYVPPYSRYIYHQMRTPEMINAPLLKHFYCDNCRKAIPKAVVNSELCVHCRVKYAENWQHFQRRPYDVMDFLSSV